MSIVVVDFTTMLPNLIFFQRLCFQKSSLWFGFLVPDFTWCNGQHDLSKLWARLDSFLANSSWIFNFDSYFNNHLPRISSDHAPTFLTTKFHSHHNSKVFRFKNFWYDYDGCHKAVFKAWNFNPHSSPMHSLTHLISVQKFFYLSGNLLVCILWR